MYYIVFCILLFFSLVEVVTHKRNWLCFDAVYALMTFMVMFRYGQFSDYFNYEMIYDYPEMTGIADPLYFITQECFKFLGVSYKGYVMVVGALTMGLIYPFLSNYCNKSITALFIFYTYELMVLPMSAIRQGVGLALLLCGFSMILEERRKAFLILVGIGSFIHVSLLAVLLIPFFYNKRYYNEWYVACALAGLTVFALVTPDLTTLFPGLFDGRSTGDAEDSRLVQIAMRLMLIAPVLYYKPQYGTLGYFAKAICIISYATYCMFAFAPLMAGRLEYYFRVFMCMLVAYMIFVEEKSRLKEFILIWIIMVHMVIFFKNMNGFIFQGEYDPDKVTMFNFPFVSVFDQDELQYYKLNDNP